MVRVSAQLISDVCRKANSKLNETRYFSGSFEPSLKLHANKSSDLGAGQFVRERAHVYPRVFERKLEVKLNGAIPDVQFKPSLKCGIAENINF